MFPAFLLQHGNTAEEAGTSGLHRIGEVRIERVNLTVRIIGMQNDQLLVLSESDNNQKAEHCQ